MCVGSRNITFRVRFRTIALNVHYTLGPSLDVRSPTTTCRSCLWMELHVNNETTGPFSGTHLVDIVNTTATALGDTFLLWWRLLDDTHVMVHVVARCHSLFATAAVTTTTACGARTLFWCTGF